MAAPGAGRGDAVSGGGARATARATGGGTWRAPSAPVRHLLCPPRARVLGALAAVGVALLAAAAPAAAQIAGVPTAPRPRRAAAADAPPLDTATRAERTSAATSEQERQRLDIQAWVDSAAGALARSAPTPIPAPGAGGRPSIFAEPAVPDSLRPPPAAAPRPAARRARRAARP